MCNVFSLLEEWAEWRIAPRISYHPSEGPSYKIMMNMPPSARHGDGGMENACNKLGYLLDRDRRCMEVDSLVRELPKDYQVLVEARFIVPPKEKTRSERAAAVICNMSPVTYRERYRSVTGWISGKLGLSFDSA